MQSRSAPASGPPCRGRRRKSAHCAPVLRRGRARSIAPRGETTAARRVALGCFLNAIRGRPETPATPARVVIPPRPLCLSHESESSTNACKASNGCGSHRYPDPRSYLCKTAVSPVAASQIREVLSSDAVAIFLPSGLNAALFTEPVWPIRTISLALAALSWALAASQMWAVLSRDAVTTRDPSGLKAVGVHGALMAAQDRGLPAVRGVPDAGGLVTRRRDDARAVAAEGGGEHLPVMAAQDRDLLGGYGVPDAGGVVSRRDAGPP